MASTERFLFRVSILLVFQLCGASVVFIILIPRTLGPLSSYNMSVLEGLYVAFMLVSLLLFTILHFVLSPVPSKIDEVEFETRPCSHCGYDLRATAEHCPECGKPIKKPVETELLNYRRHPVRRDPLTFTGSKAMKKAIEEAHSLGFTDVGLFEIKELPGFMIWVLGHVQERIWVIVHESEAKEIELDLFCTIVGGGEWRASNRERPPASYLDPLPGHPRGWIRDAGVGRLFREEWLKTKGTLEPTPLDFDRFETMYQESVRDEAELRIVVGFTPEGIRRINASKGKLLDDNQLDLIVESSDIGRLEKLDWMLRERYREISGKSEEEWKLMVDRVVVVHGQLSIDQAMNEFGDRVTRVKATHADDVIAAFDEANSQFPETDRFVKLAELEKPLRAVIFLRPEHLPGPLSQGPEAN